MDRLSLRPLEWYNLAKRHGPHHTILGEDYYSRGGVALLSVDELEEEPDVLRAPVLKDVCHDLRLLWEHTLTRRHLGRKVLAAWHKQPKAKAAVFLAAMWDARKDVHARVHLLDLCRECLGAAGANLVRKAWADFDKKRKAHVLAAEGVDEAGPRWKPAMLDDDYDEDGENDGDVSFMPSLADGDPGVGLLSSAAACCLPADESFARVVAEIEREPAGCQHRMLELLKPLRDRRVLAWIETHAQSPITSAWGNAAAASRLDWPKALEWLNKGRPMSLVALDALEALVFPFGDPDDRFHGVRLLDPPTRRTLTRVLKAYAARDSVPRVEKVVDFVLSNLDVLLDGKPYQ
jgi:hypothetical protein